VDGCERNIEATLTHSSPLTLNINIYRWVFGKGHEKMREIFSTIVGVHIRQEIIRKYFILTKDISSSTETSLHESPPDQ
jgi:hypothetical protein